MDCPICNGALAHEDTYGFLASHQSGEVLGEIYRCENHEGFSNERDAMAYLQSTGDTLDSIGVSCWEEVYCASSMHSVSGSFYTDKRGELHTGYPC